MASGHTTLEEEERNLFCLTLLLYDLGNHKLRQYFKTQWPIVLHRKTGLGTMGTEWTDQPADGNKFVVEDAGKIKFKFKAERNKVQSGDTNQWDLSLLTTVIMHSSLKFVANPSSEFDALEKLKTIRNTWIGHNSDSKISTKEFTQNWTDACKALELFGATKDEFTAIEEKLKKPSEELLKLISQLIHQEVELLNISEKIDELDKKEEEHHGEVMGALKVISMGKDSPVSSKKICIQMPPEMRLLKQRWFDFKYDVTPGDVLDNLPCLSQEDKERIKCDQNNKGSTLALETLVDRLTQTRLGFKQFVVALRKSNLDHVALLLDPSYNVKEADSYDGAVADDTKTFNFIGSAVDVHITLRIFQENQARSHDLESQIATRFRLPSSPQSRALRMEFSKHLPMGVHFVYTKQLGFSDTKSQRNNPNAKEEVKTDDVNEDMDPEHAHKTLKDSVVTVFRLAKATAVDEFWTFYQDKKLDELLRRLVVTNSQEGTLVQSKPLVLEIFFCKEDYEEIKRQLQDIESKEEVDRPDAHPVTINERKEKDDSLEEDAIINIPPVFLDKHDGSVMNYGSALKLRDYQKELAEPALNGQNTIICAPTNSGKTFVAIEIAKRHLEENENRDDTEKGTVQEARVKGSSPKVIFIVNTQNLVLQQRVRFESYLSKKYKMFDVSGASGTAVPLEFILKMCDVVVLTAQILVDALMNGDVQLSQITLLIFDECHHTQKGHPYNEIMQRYMALKHQPHQDRRSRLPQIIGLTASLGAGASKTTKQAEEHILQLCANMDAMCISTVLEKTAELEENATGSVPERKVIRVTNPTPNAFERAINQVMAKIETRASLLLSTIKTPLCNRLSEQYHQWVNAIYQEACLKALRELVIHIQQLKWYHTALLINDTVRMKDAMKYLTETFDSLEESKFTHADKLLRDLFYKAKECIDTYVVEHGETANPKLEAVKKLILELYEKETAKGNAGSKGILFTRSRYSTIALQQWISETEELKRVFKPRALMGSGDREFGMTLAEQEAIIEDFKKGDVNILIATTVAEEGVDISDCGFVIRYNMMGNEISSIQSRGRIRVGDGIYAYVADERSKGHEQEKLNQYREMLMVEAVENVQSIQPGEYRERIETIQLKNVQDRDLKAKQAAIKQNSNLRSDDVTFFCRGCNTLACPAQHFRRLMKTHHVVIDPNFNIRMALKPRNKPKKFSGIEMKKKVHCQSCDEDWGDIAKIDGTEWPCLKISSFVLELKGGERNMYKKWSEAPLTIPDADLAEILEARGRLEENRMNMDIDLS